MSFEPEPRCKNCGYDLAVADSDLVLKTAREFEATDDDLELKPPARRRAAASVPILELVRPDEVETAAADEQPHKEEWEERVFQVERIEPLPMPSPVAAPLAAQERPVPVVQTERSDVRPLDDERDEAREVPLAAVAGIPPLRPLRPVPTRVEAPAPAAPPALSPAPRAEVAAPPRPAPRAPHTTTELPLFVKAVSQREPSAVPAATALPAPPPAPAAAVEPEPMLRAPVDPQPPLSVRRSAPEPVRRESRRSPRPLGPLDRDLLEDLRRVEREELAQARAEARGEAFESRDQPGAVATPALRAGAAGVDIALLGGISLAVLWATLRVAESSFGGLGIAALVPLFAFLLIIDATYLLMFTAAGGQTLGKMLVGIRVVADDEDQEVSGDLSLRQVAWRTLWSLVAVLTLGAAWVPALYGRGQAVHDRFAHTRVVRA